MIINNRMIVDKSSQAADPPGRRSRHGQNTLRKQTNKFDDTYQGRVEIRNVWSVRPALARHCNRKVESLNGHTLFARTLGSSMVSCMLHALDGNKDATLMHVQIDTMGFSPEVTNANLSLYSVV